MIGFIGAISVISIRRTKQLTHYMGNITLKKQDENNPKQTKGWFFQKSIKRIFQKQWLAIPTKCGYPQNSLKQARTFSHFCMLSEVVTEERIKGEVSFRMTKLGDLTHLESAGEKRSTAGLFPECFTGIDSTDPAVNGTV